MNDLEVVDVKNVSSSPDALQLIEDSGLTTDEVLARHATGDWGCIPDEDKWLNDVALYRKCGRITSVYELAKGVVVVVTEFHATITNILTGAEAQATIQNENNK